MRTENIERYCEPWWFTNGYFLGKEKKPENAKFILEDGTAFPESQNREPICPAEVYRKGEYFRKYVIGYAEEVIFKTDLAEHIMSNWEPVRFDYKGCFCERCKDEFIRYSGLPAGDIEKKWPGGIIKSYEAQWIKFRAWQHAQMMKTIQDEFNTLGEKYGRDFYLIPEIAFSSLIPGSTDHYDQYNPFEYIDKLPWIEPWGTYIYSQYMYPAPPKLGIHLNTYAGAIEIKNNINKFIKDSWQRPKLIAFPHGIQSSKWVTEPEAISFETIAYFLAQWEGSFVYLFPGGYDCRYWSAMAKANDLIAHYEDFVFKGSHVTNVEVIPETPLPGPALIDTTSQGCVALAGKIKKMLLLQSVAFQLENKRMIALGNFWQKAEVFAILKILELKKDMKYVLWQPEKSRCFGNEKGEAGLNAAELENGILVHAGALRWEFFTIEPYQTEKNYGEIIKPSFMETEKAKRLPNIQSVYQHDMQMLQEASEVISYSFAEFPEINGAHVNVTPRDGMSSSVISVKTPVYQLALDMAKGGKVSSWKYDGMELSEASGICNDAFWRPGSTILNSPYRLISITPFSNGVKVVLQRKVSAKDAHGLRGLIIDKTYEFQERSLTVSVILKNAAKENISTAFRMHSIFAWNEKGLKFATSKTDNLSNIYTRKAKPLFFKQSGTSVQVIPFGLEVGGVFSGNMIEMESPDTRSNITLEYLDINELIGFVFWDSANMKVPSIEAVYAPLNLKPGSSRTYSCRLTIKPAEVVREIKNIRE